MSVKLPQPLKTARVAASAQNCESRFIIGSAKRMQNRSIVVYYQRRFAADLHPDLFPWTFAHAQRRFIAQLSLLSRERIPSWTALLVDDIG
jgi:hypothetical protein